MDMDNFDLIDDLHQLSTVALSIPLENLRSYTICFYDDYYAFEDFLDLKDYPFQVALLEADNKKISLILKNFDDAIASQCNNKNIDLSNLNITDNFEYSWSTNYEEKATAKRYKLKNILPNEVELFKKHWLLHFLSHCRQIVWNIRTILSIPQPEFHKPKNILKWCNETEKKEALLNNESVALFSSSKPRKEILNEYYKTILPQSIEITDNLFLVLEQMQDSFSDKLGYFLFEKENLNKIVANLKLQYFDKFQKAIEEIKDEDKPKFFSAYQNIINNLKAKKDIQGGTISKYIEHLQSKINIILQHPLPKVKIEYQKPKSKYNSFTYINNLTGQSNLTALKESLITKGFIAKNTELKDFRKVFSGETIEKPIVWTGKISELSYFIKQLHNELNLVEDLKQQQWAVTINCFIHENGEKYNRAKLRHQKVPTTSKNIDSVLNTLK